MFTGVINSDYTPALQDTGTGPLEGYPLTGSTASVASGRISYTLGLRCSTSGSSPR